MRALALTIAVLALPLGGCLRLSFDLCQEETPHPECDASRPVDSGTTSDAGELDAGSSDDAGPIDAGPMDAGSGEDGGLDAGAEPDAAVEDADTEMPDAGPLDAS